MNQKQVVLDIVKTYVDVFDNYEIKSAQLQGEIDRLEEKFLSFADQNPDPTVFYKKLMDSGLQEEYSALITKVAMASMQTADAHGNVKTNYSDEAPAPVVSVKEFVEQYSVPYENIKKQGYRERGEAAYEAVFAVADRTDNMLDAQLILEKERLLWKIVTEDMIDILEPISEAMDPLQTAFTINLQTQLAIYKKANSDEELVYLIEKSEFYKMAKTEEAITRMTMVISLANLLMKYCQAKNIVFEWQKDFLAKGAVASMVGLRIAIRKLLKFIKEEWGIEFSDLMADEGIKIWMLVPANADAFGRFKTALHPQNYIVFEDIIENEIKKDISVAEVLLRKLPAVFWFDFKGDEYNAYVDVAAQKAKAANASLTYYQYLDQLSVAGAEYLPKQEKKLKTSSILGGIKERPSNTPLQDTVREGEAEDLGINLTKGAKNRLKGFKFW
jgi:hypothetical protein